MTDQELSFLQLRRHARRPHPRRGVSETRLLTCCRQASPPEGSCCLRVGSTIADRYWRFVGAGIDPVATEGWRASSEEYDAMREAVIVSTARTPIGKAYRGAFNNTPAPTLAGHAISHAVQRTQIDPAEVDDVVMGCALQHGTTFMNVARQSLIRAGLPVTVSGQSLDRQCASGMMAIATAAKQIVVDGMAVAVAGGVASISTNQVPKAFVQPDRWS